MKELLEIQRKIDSLYFNEVHKKGDLAYFGLALGGEVGELQNWIKKYLRNHPKDPIREKIKANIAEESADILIYLLILSDKFDFDLKEITLKKQEINIERMKTLKHVALSEFIFEEE